jgi:spermidine dehydrogenase
MPHVTRRDFLQGTAIAVGAATPLARAWGTAAITDRYPPALTGMRGSHDGSFEVAHALAWNGKRWPRPERTADPDYDLVVVGGGISGLAAAHFYRSRVGADARILVLDNHDDLGGHAKRNEFDVGGRLLIGYGGSQTLENPGRYSVAARGLLRELGIDTDRFETYFDQDFERRFGLRDGVLFADGLRSNVFRYDGGASGEEAAAAIAAYPLSAATRRALTAMTATGIRFDAKSAQMIRDAERTPVETFLREAFAMTDEGLAFLRDLSRPLWGSGLDTLSVAESLLEYLLGTPLAEAAGAVLAEDPARIPARDESEPYICHFPDGNASVARLLARALVPGFLPGTTMEDVVLARADYSRLDRPESRVRIRLDSTAVAVQNIAGGVDVTYVRGGRAERVRGAHCVLACYNNVVPYLVDEMGAAQREALAYPEKVPFLLVNVALRNWQSVARSGYSGFYAPGGFLCYGGLDFPVSMGGYAFTARPEDPAVLQFWHAPATGPVGSDAKAQFRAGRHRLYELTFADIEREILAELDRAWGRQGLDVGRDVAAITVNRWPHGYAYEYMDLWDDPAWSRGAGPHVVARQQIGHIAIANSDSEQYAYVNGAIDAAYRAVRELTT